MLKLNDKVMTDHGLGIIKGFEVFEQNILYNITNVKPDTFVGRYQIELIGQHNWFKDQYYYDYEKNLVRNS